MNFDRLVSLFENTHQGLKQQAKKSIDLSLVVRNWLFGCYIVEYELHGEDRAEYGTEVVKTLAQRLKRNNIKGLSESNLQLFRQFFEAYRRIFQTASGKFKIPVLAGGPELQIGQTMSDQFGNFLTDEWKGLSIPPTQYAELTEKFCLGWSHYVILIQLKDSGERKFYEIEASQNNWSVRELRRQVDSALYERLRLSRDKDKVKALSEKGQVIETPQDAVKDPYVLEFLGLAEKPHYSENDLEAAIIDKLEHFLLELGKGFLFEARQKRFSFDEDHFFVDLVFYNRLLRCYVLIDLKLEKLNHHDLGQMQMYVNYFDRFVKQADENPTIGIVLCRWKNDSLVELTLPDNANIFASQYQLYLPSKEELKRQIALAEKELEENRTSNESE